MKHPHRLALIFLALLLFSFSIASAVSIKKDKGAFTVTGKNYKATVENGCIPSLIVNDVEMLNSNISISRGFYLIAVRKPVLFKDVSKNGNSLVAKSAIATQTMSFSDKSMTITVKNDSIGNVAALFVFESNLEAIRTDNGKYIKPAVEESMESATYFSGSAKVRIKGTLRLWGPWHTEHQILEQIVKPNETKQIELAFDETSKEEREHIAELYPKVEKKIEPIEMVSPKNFQVFQRKSRTEGSVFVCGKVNVKCDSVSVRITGKPLEGTLDDTIRPLDFDEESRYFNQMLTLPAGGWYKFEIGVWKEKKLLESTVVENVGVGEIFVGAGQSNSTNCGETQIKCTSLMVSTFSGNDWRIADDPQPGCHDKSTRGSFWPAFGDAMYEKFKVPIGVAVTGHGGSSVNAWQPGEELFKWMTDRMRQLGKDGFRAVLWHQGERDVSMQSDMYSSKMVFLIKGSKNELGWDFPWFVAQVSYHSPTAKIYESTRNAQKWLWDNGYALEGPDTDKLDEPYRDKDGKGIHFSEAGLKAHGKLWAEKVSAWLAKVLEK